MRAIHLTDSAIEDLDHYRRNERKIISDGIDQFLTDGADIESRRRKPMRPNSLGTWELRLGDYRVFYNIEDDAVTIVAVGHKEHADLYIRGRKVEL